MRTAFARALVVIGCLLLASAGAHGQAADGETGETDDVERRAVELFRNGERAYFAGDYEQAIFYLKEAVELRPTAVLLYNLARSYERGDRLEEAIETYRAYLTASPMAADRSTIEERIESLERERVERAAAEARLTGAAAPASGKGASAPAATRPEPDVEPRTEPVERKPEPDGASVVPWIVAGVGVLGVGAGVTTWVAASRTQRRAEDAPTQQTASELQADADDLALAGNVSVAAGGAVLVVGLVWGLVDALDDDADEAVGRLRARPGATALCIEGELW